MNQRIKKALLFLLVVTGILLMLQYALDFTYRKRVANKFSILLTHRVDPQVIMFGSSVVYHQFNPTIIQPAIGASVYNMGWPGMFFMQYNGLMDEYLSYEKNCRYLVIGCDFDNLGRTDLIRNPNLFLAYLGNNNIYRSLHDIEPAKILMARYVPGYKLTLLNKPFYTDMLLARHPADTLLGFEPLDSQWEAIKPARQYVTRYDETIFERFKSTVASITGKGVKVVLVIPPVYKDGYRLIQNADTIKSKYISLAGKDVFFLDYTGDTICNNQHYFHNFTHLNGTGANLFSHTFAHDLLKIMHGNE